MSTETVYVRAAAPDDAEALLKIYAHYVENTAVSFEYDVPGVSEFRGRMEETLITYPYLAATDGREILGYAYTGPFHRRAAYAWAAETTVYVRADRRRMGLGRLLYDALENISRAQNILNLNACIACLDVEDAYLTRGSAQFHAHMGYAPVGETHCCGYKFGRWYNILWMEKLLGEHTAQPAAVIPFPELAPDALARAGIRL